MRSSLFILFLLGSIASFAQSDECVDAVVLVPDFSYCRYVAGTSANATESLPSCSGGGNADDDVWYQFEANSSEMNIKVNPSSGYDAVVQLYSGTCGSLTQIVCRDVGGINVTERINAIGLNVSETYYIRVYHYGVGAGSEKFNICLYGVPDPTNDFPCDAFALPEVTPNCNMATFTTVGASDSGLPEPGTCGTVGYNGGDVWFSVEVPSNGAIEVSTISGVIVDGAMGIYSGACGSLSLISCNDDFSATNLMPYIYETGLTPGEIIYIRFWEFNNDNPGTFSICVSSPLNDLCVDATMICDFNGYGGLTSAQYTAERPGNMHGNNELPDGTDLPNGTNTGGPFGGAIYDVNIDNNAWITFVANATTAILDVEVEYCLRNLGLQMQIFSGNNCDNFAPVSNFLETTASQTLVATGLIPGNTYYIMTDGYAGDVCNYTITAEEGVEVLEVTSSAGTSVCPGQPTTLTALSSGVSVNYFWESNPGGVFGSNSQTEIVTVTVPTVYMVTVTGYCDAAVSSSITVTPDKTSTVDFYATAVPTSLLEPSLGAFPLTFSCEDDSIALWAFDSVAANGIITPAIGFEFITDDNTIADNTSLTIYKNGSIFYQESPLPAGEELFYWTEYISTSDVFTFELCDDNNDGYVGWKVIDLNTTDVLGSGDFLTGNPCETYGPFSVSGLSTWSISPASGTAALHVSDSGLAYLDPKLLSAGVYDITYCWDNTVGCNDCETKSITITNPHNASWNAPASYCNNIGIVNLTSLIDVSASSTSGVWSGTAGVTNDEFDPTGIVGNVTITYTVGGPSPCEASESHVIEVLEAPVSFNTTLTECDLGGGNAVFDLSAQNSTINGATALPVVWYEDIMLAVSITDASSFNTNTTTTYALVTHPNTCTDTAEVSVIVLDLPIANTTISDVSCNNGSDGSIVSVVSGGGTSYTYTWSNLATTSSIFGLSTGNYYLTITDNLNCTSNYRFFVTQPPAFSYTISETQPLCHNETGEVEIVPQPICNYTVIALNEVMYRPGINDGLTSNTGEYLELIGPPGMDISCYVLSDGDWAITIPQGTVVPNSGIFTLGNDGAWGAGFFDLDVENCACYTTGTGGNSILILANAGEYVALFDHTGNYLEGLMYGSPTAGNTPPSGALTDVGGVINTIGLAGCPASVTIPDATFFETHPGGVASNTSLIRDPDGSGGWSTQSDGSPNQCNAETLATYTYIWNTGATTNNVTGLTDGNYSVTIGDGGSCAEIESFTITVPSAISVSPSITDVTCNNGSDGEITISANGGTGTLDFLWNTTQTSQTITGLSANTYSVTASDENNCTEITSITISEPTALTITPDVTQVSCFGESDGSIVLILNGSETPYAFAWQSGETTQTLTSLAEGVYHVTVSSGLNCLYDASITITQPSLLSITLTESHVTCNGFADGSIVSAVSGGGSTNYSYSWNPGGGGASSLVGLVPDNYAVTVSSGICTITDQVSITEPSVLNITLTGNNISCFGQNDGASEVVASGGPSSSYSYLWSNGNSNAAISNLSSNVYAVTVSSGVCSETSSITLTQPNALTISETIQSVGCFGESSGSIDIVISGGTPPYSYTWNQGSTDNSIDQLIAGNYSVTVTDAGSITSCEQIQNFTITEPLELIVSETITPTCIGTSDGSIQTMVSGGISGYFYLWNTGATTDFIDNLSFGNYELTLTDASSCEKVFGFTVGSLPQPIANNYTAEICENIDNPGVAIVVDLTDYNTNINSNIGLNIQWFEADGVTPVNIINNVSVSNSSNYIVVVDNGVCVNSAILSFSILNQPTVNIVGGGVFCYYTSPANMPVTFQFSGNSPYTFTYEINGFEYQVSNFSQNQYTVPASQIEGGTYLVTEITNGNNCTNTILSDSITVDFVGPEADFQPSVDSGDPPLSVVFTNNSTQTGFETYSWNFGNGLFSNETEPVVVYNNSGEFDVVLVVEDIYGCVDTAFYEIFVGDSSYIFVPTVFTPNGDGVNDVFEIKSVNLESLTCEIFNRWGQKLFIIDQVGMSWEGRTFVGETVTDGVYFYVLNAKGKDGKVYEQQGTFTLIR
jgi:gliding motility-associated-like protein